MKKLIRILSLVVMAALLCTMLVACSGKPAEDYREAKKALKEAGYEVDIEQENEDGEEYTVLEAHKFDPEIDMDDIIDELEAMEGETVVYDYVMVIYFEDEEAAEEAFEGWIQRQLEDIVSGAEKRVKRWEEYVDVEFELGEPTLDGCMIYVGTPNALSDAS